MDFEELEIRKCGRLRGQRCLESIPPRRGCRRTSANRVLPRSHLAELPHLPLPIQLFALHLFALCLFTLQLFTLRISIWIAGRSILFGILVSRAVGLLGSVCLVPSVFGQCRAKGERARRFLAERGGKASRFSLRAQLPVSEKC